MRRQNDEKEEVKDEVMARKNTRKGKRDYKKGSKSRNNGRQANRAKIEVGDYNNDPNWYYTDANVADQVSQLSMRDFLGVDCNITGPRGASSVDVYIPSIINVYLNPGAGANGVVVQQQQQYVPDNRMSGINMAGFRTYSKLAAFTGRALTYGPQDISIMILALGEVISCVEYLRRALGVAYTYNVRNRSYPSRLIDAMGIDHQDMFQNYALYRNRFNELVTRINQIPIPKGIAYFDKCASLYEHIYLDSDSPMAQTIVTVPFTTWTLNEQGSSLGSTLETTSWGRDGINQTWNYRPMSYYFNQLQVMVDSLLNSSTLNVVYADILNFFNKVGGDIWKFDYFIDGYQVIPEFNLGFLLQLHNATFTGVPNVPNMIGASSTNARIITPLNDVICDANNNQLLYNPGFSTGNNNYSFRWVPDEVFVDFLNPNPTVTDRVEITRMISIPGPTYNDGTTEWVVDGALPDHYCVVMAYMNNDATTPQFTVGSVISSWYNNRLSISQLDYHPIHYIMNSAGTGIDRFIDGELNYFTTVDYDLIDPIHRFVGLSLYDLR